LLKLLGGIVLRKALSVIVVAFIVIIAAVYLFLNKEEKVIEPETVEKEADTVEQEEVKPDNQNESFTFEPFTLSMATVENIEVGKPFEVEGKLENTYTGPVTLTEGSKCTEEITYSFIPFSEYAEGQPAPECKDSTKEVVLKVDESITTNAELVAEKDEPYILTGYFAGLPLLKKVLPADSADFDEKTASHNLGELFLEIKAQGSFKAGERIYLTAALTNKGENFIRLKENSCNFDLKFTAKSLNDNVILPGAYGPCEDNNRTFNLQAGDSLNGYTSFAPEEAGTYSVTVSHVNDVEVELDFDVE